jgi:hypothetical protein
MVKYPITSYTQKQSFLCSFAGCYRKLVASWDGLPVGATAEKENGLESGLRSKEE